MNQICRYKQRAGFLATYYKLPMALRIKELREARGWTQDELAEKASVSRSQLAQIESEARPANTLRLNAIAAALGVKPGRLFSTSAVDDKLLDFANQLNEDDLRTLLRMAEAMASQAEAR